MLLAAISLPIYKVVMYVFAFGLGVVCLTYIAHLLAPAGGPPQYILDMEASQLLSGRESEAAEVAVAALVEDVPEVGRAASSRTTVDDEVLTRYNAYKADCLKRRKEALGLSRWLHGFDPDLYHRVFSED